MRLILIMLVSLSAHAAVTQPSVDKIKSMLWDGEKYTLKFTNYEKEIKISDKNQVVPCLENAVKGNMEVLITIDSDIPMVKSCKLYSASLPATKPSMQGQEDEGKPVKKIK